MISNSSNFLKAFFGIIVVLGIVELLIVGVVAGDHDEINGGRKMIKSSTTGNMKNKYNDQIIRAVWKVEQLNNVSKRRVPNGSDPIHNRRAGSSNHPPGQE